MVNNNKYSGEKFQIPTFLTKNYRFSCKIDDKKKLTFESCLWGKYSL